MAVLTQSIQVGEFLLSEASGERSREQVTVTVAGSVALPSGTVLGKITATGKYIKYLNGAVDGSQTAAAILLNPLAAVNGDYKCAVFVRDCEVSGAMLNGGSGVDAPGAVELVAAGVIVR